jgi:hypothetical protein
MALELAERLATLRRQLNAELPLPGNVHEGYVAWEVISKSYRDGKPDWEGLRYADGNVTSSTNLSEIKLKRLSREIENLRRKHTATTHWEIAVSDRKMTIPSLIRVVLKLGSENGVQVQQLKDWISGEWSPVEEELRNQLDKLHDKVLWEQFFRHQHRVKHSAISFVYFFKVGDNVLGIWVLHGYGDAVVGGLEELSNERGGIFKLIQPSTLCLSESVKKRLDELEVVRWDLALLAQNSLRVESAITLKGFKHDIEAAGSTNIAVEARKLLEASPCDDHKGLHKYYETVFDRVIGSALPQDCDDFLPAFSTFLAPETCSILRRLYVSWNLLTRACGIPRSADDLWHTKGRRMLEQYFQEKELVALHDKISTLWVLRSKKGLSVSEQDELSRLLNTLPKEFWQIARTRVFGNQSATWEAYVAETQQDEQQKMALLRLPNIFFLQPD